MITLLSKVADFCVGLEYEKAKYKIEKAGATVRLVEVNGTSFMLTADEDPKRINLVLKKGYVTEAYVG